MREEILESLTKYGTELHRDGVCSTVSSRKGQTARAAGG
jgi:hypothetical protein